MSFSEEIKEEILIKEKMKMCCKKAMRYGELFTETSEITAKDIKDIICDRLCCKKSFLKGVFLGSGYIVSPENEYHFEVSLETKSQSNFVMSLFSDFDVSAKCIKRNKYVVYVKDSEGISNILRIFGATTSLMKFENIRIEKSIKNDINRGINCETANLNKIVSSAYRQIQAIQKLEENGTYNSLKDKQKELCKLRKKFPDKSLEELASLCSYSISKSGVYHSLNKIVKLAGMI